MLSLEECKKYLHNLNLTDEEIIKIRSFLYYTVNQIIDQKIESQYEKEKS
jgi:hypothetical protein